MLSVKNIYQYYLQTTEIGKLTYLDVLQDILNWIDGFNAILWVCSKSDTMKLIFDEEMRKELIRDFKIRELSGFTFYKKTDMFSPELTDKINVNNPTIIANISLGRRGFITKLIQEWIIEDLKVSEEKVFWRMEDMKDFIKWEKRWEYKIDTSALVVSNTEYWIWKDIRPLTQDNVGGYALIKFLQQFIPEYGEDELNRQLNLDDSYKKMLFYKCDRDEIEKLMNQLKTWQNKKILKKIRFQNNLAYINNMKYTFQKDKAWYFFWLIAQYFSENPHEDSVSTSDLQDIHIERENKTSISFWDSLRTWYIKTLNDRIYKKYINWRIFEIKKGVITIKEMDNL